MFLSNCETVPVREGDTPRFKQEIGVVDLTAAAVMMLPLNQSLLLQNLNRSADRAYRNAAGVGDGSLAGVAAVLRVIASEQIAVDIKGDRAQLEFENPVRHLKEAVVRVCFFAWFYCTHYGNLLAVIDFHILQRTPRQFIIAVPGRVTLHTIPPVLIICGLPFKDTLPPISGALFKQSQKIYIYISDSPLSIKDGLPLVSHALFYPIIKIYNYTPIRPLSIKDTLPPVLDNIFFKKFLWKNTE